MICYYCKKEIEKGKEIKDNKKNFHKECYQEYLARKKLNDYILEQFKLKKIGPKIASQIKRYRQQGINYETQLNILIYAFNVKKIKVLRDNKGYETIGIIPYLKQEAENYWKEKEKETNNRKDEIKTVEIYTEKEKKSKKIIKEFNMEDFLKYGR